MFLDSEPEGEIQLPRSGMPLKEKKRTATLLTATEKIYMFLSSSPSVTKGKPFFFSSVKGSVHSQALTCKSSFDMLICACNTAFILSRNYMHAWHAVPSCKGNKIKTNSKRVSFYLARPRECVWTRCFCGWVREFDQNLLWQVLVRDSGLHSRHISNPNLCTFMRSYSKWRWNLRLGNKRCSGHRKFFISSLELVFICSLNDKQEFILQNQ